jgi:hypothetical protein
MTELLEAAQRYLRRGWMPVYVPPGVKGPNRKGWEKQRLTEAELPAHFSRPGNVGIILGEASGNLVDVDLDCPEALELADRYLPATPSMTGRPSAPRSHRWYVSDVPATRQFRDPKTREMIVELRSTGGQTLVGPSRHDETDEPYDCLHGEPARVPADVLAEAVQSLHEEVVRRRHGEVPAKRNIAPPANASRPVNNDAAVERRASAYLQAMSPAISGSGGHAATYAAATALVYGFGLSIERALGMLLAEYNPRCQPPWTGKEIRHKVEDAAAKPHDRIRGWLRDQKQAVTPVGDEVDLSGILAKTPPKGEKKVQALADPGPVPESMLRVPGFICEVMDYTLATAPYPQLELAFAGALSLQSLLAGRKVMDALSNRTTLYVVALAHSGAGKDHPRKVNQRVLLEAGMPDSIGDTFASGEGIEDRLHITNSVLFQTDEIDALMAAIREGKEMRYVTILNVLLRLFTSCNGVYSLRVKAGKEFRYIAEPNLCIFGTAIPRHYYESLSPKMLTDGFFARIIVIEAGKRGTGQEPPVLEIPPRVTETARWWASFKPGSGPGNLTNWHPRPRLVELTPDALAVMREARKEADEEYAKAQADKDDPTMAIWARAYEKARRLALIHACSENYLEPTISRQAAEWAWTFARHQTRRMLFMAQSHVAENPFHAQCLKLMEKLRGEPDKTLSRTVLLKRMKTDAQSFQKIVDTLLQQEDIEVDRTATPGRTGTRYRLLEG